MVTEAGPLRHCDDVDRLTPEETMDNDTMTVSSTSSRQTQIATRKVLRDQVYDVLVDRIAGGEFPAGEALGIDPLAVQLGVSPTPVREALVQLEATGLVVRTALRGYRVAPPLSRGAMEELFDARQLIETGAARVALRNQAELLPILRDRHERHRTHTELIRSLNASDPAYETALGEYLKADWGFHQAIFDATRNRFITHMSQRISTHSQRLRQFVDTQMLDAENALEEHGRILDAAESGDVEAVVAAMASHIDSVRKRAFNSIGDATV